MDLLPPLGWCAAGLDVVLEVVLPATGPVGLRVGLHREADRGAVMGGVEHPGGWSPPRPFERAEDAVVLGQDEDPAGVQQDGRRSTGRTDVARSHKVHPFPRTSALSPSPVPRRQPRQTRTHFDLDTTVRRCSRRARRRRRFPGGAGAPRGISRRLGIDDDTATSAPASSSRTGGDRRQLSPTRHLERRQRRALGRHPSRRRARPVAEAAQAGPARHRTRSRHAGVVVAIRTYGMFGRSLARWRGTWRRRSCPCAVGRTTLSMDPSGRGHRSVAECVRANE